MEEGAGREDEEEGPEPEDVVSDGGLVDDVEVDLETPELRFVGSKTEGEAGRSISSLRKACDRANSLSWLLLTGTSN